MSDSRSAQGLAVTLIVVGSLLLAAAIALDREHRAESSGPVGPGHAERPGPMPEPIPAPPDASPVEAPAPTRLEATLVARQEQTALKATRAGTIEWLASDGTAVVAGKISARLAGVARARHRLQTYADRRAHYQRKADKFNAEQAAAAANNNVAAIRRYGALYAKAKAKVEEKQRGIDDSRARLAALELTAPAIGVFERVLAPGDAVVAGDTIAVITRTDLTATFVTDAAESDFTVDQEVVVEIESEERAGRCMVIAVVARQITVACPTGTEFSALDVVTMVPR